MLEVIKITQDLIRMDTINPPGNEGIAANYIGNILSKGGLDVKYHSFKNETRLHVIAEIGISKLYDPIVFTGHFDTVPIGSKQWSDNPLSGKIEKGKIFGRGSSDMKSGVASIVCAVLEIIDEMVPTCGIRLILTAGEEIGCEGANDLMKSDIDFGSASAIIVAEPTSNIPAIAHKGALFINATTTGKTAHSSMPQLGSNAIYKAARAIAKIEKFKFEVEEDKLLGYPTLNVGMIQGGKNANSIPDEASFTIDVRTTSKLTNSDALEILKRELGEEIKLSPFVDTGAVYNDESIDFVKIVNKICHVDKLDDNYTKALPYATDGAVLQQFYNGVPTMILGPGQPELAHQIDEFCYTEKIIQSVKIYKNIIAEWSEHIVK